MKYKMSVIYLDIVPPEIDKFVAALYSINDMCSRHVFILKDDTDILPIGELVFMTLELLRVLSASLP